MLVSAREGHRIWAASYDSGLNPLLALQARLLPEVIGPVESRRVVDVACGTGRWAAYLLERGADVIGVDFSDEMLNRAPARVRSRLVLADGASLPIASDTVDLTICCFAAAYFPDLERAVSEMARITRPGGRLVISDLHPAGVEAGWTRSFRVDGAVYEMEHFRYSLEQIGRTVCRTGLASLSELHAAFGEPEREIFEAADKMAIFAAVSKVPALWIGSWRKV